SVERRFPSLRYGRPDRKVRCVLHGLPRASAGVCLGHEVRLSVSRAVVSLAEKAARLLEPRLAARGHGHFHTESRPDSKFRQRPASAGIECTWSVTSLNGDNPARTRHSDAFPRAGVLRVFTFLLFRRSQ